MLILSRKVGEVICISDDVTITVLAIRNGQIKVGIDAPKTISVHREEIYNRIKKGTGDSNASHQA